jgi:Tfp pilus assembly protein PilZ
MFVETATPARFGADVIIHVELPGQNGPVSLPGVVRWVRDGGMGVQFGLLGAVETHIITEISRQYTTG